uniref:CSON001067 protein n=1 Tax=Culicoides sonorensis TaxID=179676 RepID=A0A336M2W1_CULSO
MIFGKKMSSPNSNMHETKNSEKDDLGKEQAKESKGPATQNAAASRKDPSSLVKHFVPVPNETTVILSDSVLCWTIVERTVHSLCSKGLPVFGKELNLERDDLLIRLVNI